ncbi:hypothetical protein [Micromonospora saelicesensis]|uniref:hypothetical protein n=1 Tax=Micromonospora saelicesensis TaxID=285676 RepID=UPI0015EB4B23|nr:hypothetical protein [Micromonospora saelicesensis]
MVRGLAPLTDRFRRMVDQLGSDKLDVRINGLHALWQIAEHSVYAAQSASR